MLLHDAVIGIDYCPSTTIYKLLAVILGHALTASAAA